ncbi:MAG: hypothetical protein ACRDRV_07315 [Pseudonocardiaceae bacterium]
MTGRRAAAVGSAVSFVMAGGAGVIGGSISKEAGWAWFAFGAVLLVGALVTGWAAYRAAGASGSAGPAGGVRHVGNVNIGDVSAGEGSQAAGVNYGTMSQTHHDEDP